MVKENGKEENDKNGGDDKGKETPIKTEEPKEPVETVVSPLDEAKEINKKKEELLEREEKLQTRKEKMLAEEQVGGRASSGEAVKVEETAEEKAARFEKGELDIFDEKGERSA